MMFRLKRALALLRRARSDLKAAGAPPLILEHLDALIRMLVTETD
jgi:hypothetical protein